MKFLRKYLKEPKYYDPKMSNHEIIVKENPWLNNAHNSLIYELENARIEFARLKYAIWKDLTK